MGSKKICYDRRTKKYPSYNRGSSDIIKDFPLFMIASMTDFARKAEGAMMWEIRSVNHRYLEITLRLPESLRLLEQPIRENIQHRIKRGKIEAVLKYQPNEVPLSAMTVNSSSLMQLAEVTRTVAQHFPQSHLNLIDVLTWPDILQTEDAVADSAHKLVLTTLQVTLEDLLAAKQREGNDIACCIEKHLSMIQTQLHLIQKRIPIVLQVGYDKMQARFTELALSLDKERLEQEMVWLAQKIDITEECHRLHSHALEVKRVLQQKEAAGRRLDFLAQELHREANTLASKSIDAEVSRAAIELKVQIEQIREQVQNIE